MEIPGADISASASMDRSLVWNFHMSWAATDVMVVAAVSGRYAYSIQAVVGQIK